jgi:CDP-diacylglycerol--glycerol-3-phosphate 3-phosphatidyltransferase
MLKATNALTIPNFITTARILMAVVAALLFALEHMEKLAVILCVSAALLDALDGWCARLFSQCSQLGKLLDPLADKLIITVMYAVIAIQMNSTIIWILFAMMLFREIGITLLRDFAFRKRNILISSSSLGKIKMVTQTLIGSAIIVIGYFFMDKFGFPVYVIASAMIFILAITYLSAYQYITSWKASISAKRDLPEAEVETCARKPERMVAGK